MDESDAQVYLIKGNFPEEDHLELLKWRDRDSRAADRAADPPWPMEGNRPG